MGVHSGLVATRSTTTQLANELANIWPRLQVVATKTTDSYSDYESWRQANERFVSARDWRPDNRGVEIYALLQSGSWSVLLDSSYVLAGDEVALAKLSQMFGYSISFVTETTGGYASFLAFANGSLSRRVQNTSGQVVSDGAPLQEEAGLAMGQYYMAESEELQRRLGVGPISEASFQSALAIAAVDQTDYSSQVQVLAQSLAPAKKPWWRLW